VGQLDDALQWYERHVRALNADWKRPDGSPLSAWFEMDGLDRTRRPEDLERIAVLLSGHVAFVRREWPNERDALAKSLAELGRCRLKQGRFAEAEAPLRESLAIRQKNSPNSWTTYQTWSQLGGSLLGQKKYAQAEPHLLDGFSGLKNRIDQMGDEARVLRLGQATEWLVELYTAIGKPDEAAKWRAERAKYLFVASMPREVKRP